MVMVPEYYPECVSLHCRIKNSTCLNLWSKLNGRCGNFYREPGDPLPKTLTLILGSGFKIHNIILSSPSPPHVESYKIFQVQFAFNMDKREFLATKLPAMDALQSNFNATMALQANSTDFQNANVLDYCHHMSLTRR
jgi:hypothetical protein